MMSNRGFSDVSMPLFQGDEARPAPLPNGQMPSYIRDHRKRLRDRFMAAGGDALPDYELLELLLFRAIPRQDVKPLARRLLEVFGSYNGVLSAPTARLGEVKGVGAAVICELKLVEAAAHRLARSRSCSGVFSAVGMPCSTIARPPWRIATLNSFAFYFWIRKTL